MDMSADNLAMLDPTEFGATSLLIAGNPVSGIFDADYFEVTNVDSGVESSQPGVLCRSSDVSGVVHNDPVVVDGVNYVVVNIRPDGTGMTELMLEKA
jgi:hypothetical protein